MLPYLICYLLPVGILLFLPSKNHSNKKIIVIMLIPLFVLTALKGVNVGSDTYAYNAMFNTMRNGTFYLESSYDRLEIGYKCFLWLLTRISGHPQIQYIVSSIFCFIVYTYFLDNNSEDSALYLILFMGLNVYNFYFSGVRQSIAMTICLIAYEQAKKRHLIKYIIIVGIAFLFHKVSVFFLLAYVFTNRKVSKKIIPVYVIMFVMMAVFRERLFLLGGEIFDINYGIETAQNGYVMLTIVFIITILSFVNWKKLTEMHAENIYLIQLNIITMGFWLLRLFSRTAERPALLFMPFTILLGCQLMKCLVSNKDRVLVNFMFTTVMGVYFIYRLNGLGLMPYMFFWQ